MSVTIEIQELTKVKKKAIILENISLQLNSGKIYAFQGINGSGKSMLFRAISGLLIPTSGTIKINNQELHKELSFPQNIGVVIEMPEFLPQYTGFKNLKILSEIKKVIGENEINDALKLVGLDPADKRKYRKYSLGMKQRLSIAQAIMEKPDILILDEPTNALDEQSVQKLITFLKEYREQDKLICISSHDQEFLKEICDELITLENGKVIKHQIIKNDSTNTHIENKKESLTY
ncbi:ABC transporter ATP-binding protein [Bacillus pseudomycoides]|uniref:ABC transporter ATP-binding protein n=1 Tax=Bacillus pseudomycoides TaxID=64104 RepID=UPI000BED0A60|nr:ABC transporter ATP-binding protein [Bacillus pseudomycoides]PDY44062.1 multidrug ABC transporter ATP-binding protein [Bacillus pseudomycoides]PHB31894.1 multidrug ABC transporter ATP-binding protein [Bacillus pseudomycoides]